MPIMTYVPMKSIWMGDSEFSHGCQKFPNLWNIPHAYVIHPMAIKVYAYSNGSILTGDDEFSHSCQEFPNLEKIPTL